jgi:RNA polymerase sigma-70 factor, ECF subfamily
MLLVAEGDSLAQRTVVARVMGRIKGVCHSLLRDRADADDQVQVTLLQVLRSASTYRGEGSLEGWADRIAVRNAMRAVAARRRTIERVAEDIEPDDVATTAAESDVSEDAPRAATVYLQSLPETTRTVLTLRHQLGYSVREIAELTGVSPNTVKDRLVRGREQLRKLVRRHRVIGAKGSE